MDLHHVIALVLDPSVILTAQGLVPDPWQRSLLLATDQYLLLNCCRQSGKSTTVAALALHQALIKPRALVLLIAPAERQSHELLKKVMAGYRALGQPLDAVKCNQGELELQNGSRIVALPGREKTIRSYSGVNLLIIDEAARVPDDMYRSVRPMLAVSRGRLVALSTPFGQQGWFYHEWQGTGPWKRVQISWQECPRIKAEDIAEEVRALTQDWVDQEYGCMFTALEGLVYPDFPMALVEDQPLPAGKQVGGIDFGWRNPFAAVWGVLDKEGVLWIGSELYVSETLPHERARVLPKKAMWYADPSSPSEIEELRARDFRVRKGDNNIQRGIAAVTARIRTGRLKVLPACVNLIAESRLYRYPTAAERALRGEKPIDAHNHALAALRYLISRLDGRPGSSGPGTEKKDPPPPTPVWPDDYMWRPV